MAEQSWTIRGSLIDDGVRANASALFEVMEATGTFIGADVEIQVVKLSRLEAAQASVRDLDRIVSEVCVAVGEPIPRDAVDAVRGLRGRLEAAERERTAAVESRENANAATLRAEAERDAARSLLAGALDAAQATRADTRPAHEEPAAVGRRVREEVEQRMAGRFSPVDREVVESVVADIAREASAPSHEEPVKLMLWLREVFGDIAEGRIANHQTVARAETTHEEGE